MTSEDFISKLFYRIDAAMIDIPQRPLFNL